MAILSSSGNDSSSRSSPWRSLENGDTSWPDFSPRQQEEIVRHYAPKIKILALRLKTKLPKNVELNELISAGSLGLLEALGKFCPDQGVKFDTYAENRIKGAMLDELRRMDWFSRGLRRKVKVLEDAARQLEHSTGETPTVDQLVSFTGMAEKEVRHGLEALQNQLCLSLDAFHDHIAARNDEKGENEPYHSAALQEIIEIITELIGELTSRERLVLSLYYGEELNMKETAQVMDITEGRVSQLHSQALGKLKKLFKARYEMQS
ncbi:MAG: polymerase sigma factor FliA [Desulfovibrionales bacterium]|jgi:RNA polymerase sigma factor for flagellar operon FliA|nr:polymerase sigma factor FliA [Desulfovibrionales bacterium]